jgi:hypothetical protein
MDAEKSRHPKPRRHQTKINVPLFDLAKHLFLRLDLQSHSRRAQMMSRIAAGNRAAACP